MVVLSTRDDAFPPSVNVRFLRGTVIVVWELELGEVNTSTRVLTAAAAGSMIGANPREPLSIALTHDVYALFMAKTG
jgi:hypothetical protein